MESLINSHAFYEFGRVNSVHSLFREVHWEVSSTWMNYYELEKS